jgi:hypothetical protein
VTGLIVVDVTFWCLLLGSVVILVRDRRRRSAKGLAGQPINTLERSVGVSKGGYIGAAIWLLIGLGLMLPFLLQDPGSINSQQACGGHAITWALGHTRPFAPADCRKEGVGAMVFGLAFLALGAILAAAFVPWGRGVSHSDPADPRPLNKSTK